MGIKRFVRCIIAIILIAFALFTFLSFLSYSSNDPPFADYPINNPIKKFLRNCRSESCRICHSGHGKNFLPDCYHDRLAGSTISL